VALDEVLLTCRSARAKGLGGPPTIRGCCPRPHPLDRGRSVVMSGGGLSDLLYGQRNGKMTEEQDLDKLDIMEKLRSAGVWEQAEAYREEVRKRLKSEGRGRAEAVNLAWKAMCDLFLPLTEGSQRTPSLQVVLGGSIDEILDSAYTESDTRKRIRDSVLWAAEQFRRVVEDRPTGTIVDFTKAAVPPPTVFAIQVVESYAATKDRRGELIGKIMTFADRSSQESRGFGSSKESGGFLDSLLDD